MTVKELALFLKCPYEGNSAVEITGISSLEKAERGDLVFLAHSKYRSLLDQTRGSAAIILPSEQFDRIPVIRSENPYLTFIQSLNFFYAPYKPEPGVHPQAYISPSAKIGKEVSIGAFAAIGDSVEIGDRSVIYPLVSIYPRVTIGKDCVLHSHVSVREDVRIGNRVIIHNGAVIGSDGFGYLQTKESSHIKIPQKGTVVIEDNVEIGANTAIDRAALDETVIQEGAKIDNLVQVAHNVEVGSHSIIAGQAGIAGSTKLGKNVVLGGQVGISDHIHVGDNASIAARGGVMNDIPPHSFVAGAPAVDFQEWRKTWAAIPHLYDLIKEVRRLRKKVEELEKRLK